MNWLLLADGIFYVCCGLVGLLLGSFITVVITRLPAWEQYQYQSSLEITPSSATAPANLCWPGSRCPHCLTALRLADNLPLIGFIRQRGRCRHCQKPISSLYPWVETLSLVLTVWVGWRFGFREAALWALIPTLSLLALAFIDGREQLLPDGLTQPLLWCGFLAALRSTDGSFPIRLDLAVIGAMSGFAVLWTLRQGFYWATRRDGLGYGDLKLLAAIGAWVGVTGMLQILFLASVIGLATALALIALKKRSWHEPLPFGSFLAVSAILLILVPPTSLWTWGLWWRHGP
jgi:leader peptidase (prepilin peptidase) / N-methyltransferase